MVKITLITNAGRKTVMASETKTPRQIYEENEVNYESCTNTIDSVPVKIGDLDKTLTQLEIGETCRMSSIVKMDNASSVVICGDACVVKSAVKLDDWKKALKYDPEFGLYDEDGEPLFKVDIEPAAKSEKEDMVTTGSINKYGVMFAANPDHEGNAIVTMVFKPGVTDKVGTIADKYGIALARLNQLEAKVVDKVAAANEMDAQIRGSITEA